PLLGERGTRMSALADVARGIAASPTATGLLCELPQPCARRHASIPSAGAIQRRRKLRTPGKSHASLRFGISDPAKIIPHTDPSQTRACTAAPQTPGHV